MLHKSSFFHRFWVGNPSFGIVTVNQPVSPQWIRKGREVVCDLKFLRLVSLLFFFISFFLHLSKFPGWGIHKFPLELFFSSCVHSSLFLFVGILKKQKIQRGVWSYTHSSVKIDPKFLQQIMNSKFTLLPPKKEKKKFRKFRVSWCVRHKMFC